MVSVVKEVRRFESSVARRPTQFLLATFSNDEPPDAVQGGANFFAQVIEDAPDRLIRVSGTSVDKDGNKYYWSLSRNESGVYESSTKGRMFMPGDLWTIDQHLEFEIIVQSAGSWFVTEVVAEVFQKRSGAFRKWASGAYTEALARESVRTTLDEVMADIRRDDNDWNDIWFPASRQTVKYSIESEPYLLERMTSEVGELLGRPIVPFRKDSDSSRMERLDSERLDSTSPSSGTYRQQLGLTPIERGGKSATDAANSRSAASTGGPSRKSSAGPFVNGQPELIGSADNFMRSAPLVQVPKMAYVRIAESLEQISDGQAFPFFDVYKQKVSEKILEFAARMPSQHQIIFADLQTREQLLSVQAELLSGLTTLFRELVDDLTPYLRSSLDGYEAERMLDAYSALFKRLTDLES